MKDRFADSQSFPPLDKENNYNLTGFEESEGKTVLRFSRKFDTCDPRDRKIEVILNIAYSFFLPPIQPKCLIMAKKVIVLPFKGSVTVSE